MNNFLIFGGNGFISSHLILYIDRKVNDKRIYSLDIDGQLNYPMNLHFQACDVRDPIKLNGYQEADSDIIFNLAAVHKTPGHPDSDYFQTNIRGAENVCNFARVHDISTIVFTSSIAPYGASEDIKNEETTPMPNSPYGISKLVAEHIHRTWQAEEPNRRKLIIFRPGVVFGSGEGGNFSRLYLALSKGIFMYPGRKDTLKACVYVKDVARIVYESAVHVSPGVHLFNLTYTPPPTIEMICNEISIVTGVAKPKLLIPGIILRGGAKLLSVTGKLAGGNLLNSIHPNRVKKLMISTNIDGSKLGASPYKLQYSLRAALQDWFLDCENKGLF